MHAKSSINSENLLLLYPELRNVAIAPLHHIAIAAIKYSILFSLHTPTTSSRFTPNFIKASAVFTILCTISPKVIVSPVAPLIFGNKISIHHITTLYL